jgi:hypothetical protein
LILIWIAYILVALYSLRNIVTSGTLKLNLIWSFDNYVYKVNRIQ